MDAGFFFNQILQFLSEFADAEDDGSEFSDLYQRLEEFGFFPTMKRLCGNDITKRDEVLKTDCRTVYMWLKIDSIESKIEREVSKRIQRKKK